MNYLQRYKAALTQEERNEIFEELCIYGDRQALQELDLMDEAGVFESTLEYIETYEAMLKGKQEDPSAWLGEVRNGQR